MTSSGMSLRPTYGMSGTDVARGTASVAATIDSSRSSKSHKMNLRVSSAIPLRACYAMPGTDKAYAAICLRFCCAMSGTDLAYAATSQAAPIAYVPSTYARATRCPVLT
mgnify:CR=1 FL=1